MLFKGLEIDTQAKKAISILKKWGEKSATEKDFEGEFSVPLRLRKELKSLGFKEVRTNNYVFIGKNFVVKIPYYLGNRPKYFCPTKKIIKNWVIQPKLEKITPKEFYNIKKEAERRFLSDDPNDHFGYNYFLIDNYGEDYCIRNMGKYKGKIVSFDW